MLNKKPNILQEIVSKRVASFPARFSAERLKELNEKLSAVEKPRPFYNALASPEKWALIAEIKSRSPSRGRLMPNADPISWSKLYERCGASAISVVTDENYFGGKTKWIEEIKQVVSLPVLRKDFLTTQQEILESRAAGADAVLLIAAILTEPTLRALVDEVMRYGMEPLVEVHDEEEIRKALKTQARMIGINNRNLQDFSVDISTTKTLAPLLTGRTIVSESGIFSSREVKDLHACGVKVFLVGEAILTASNPEQKIADLLA